MQIYAIVAISLFIIDRCSGQGALVGNIENEQEKVGENTKEPEHSDDAVIPTSTVRPRKEFKPEDVDTFVENILKCRNIPAAVVSILRLDDRNEPVLTFNKGYGRLNPTCESSTCEKPNENTKFCIGSITKSFTAGVLGKQLWENEKLKETLWDTPLKKLLPCDQRDFFSGDTITEKITVRDLLAHRMGLPAGDLVWFLGTETPRKDIWKNIHRMEQHDSPLASTWRSSFMYNNWIYALAGHVSEILSNQTWENLVQKYYFDTLGMKDSTFTDKQTSWSDFARFGFYKNEKWSSSDEMMNLLKNPNVVAPAGGICTTGSDMIKYMKYLLSNITEGDPLGVPRNIILDTFIPSNYFPFTKRIISKPAYPVYSGMHTYGLGWFQRTYREYQAQSHEGGIYGYFSELILFPDDRLGVFVSTTNSLDKDKSLAPIIAMHAADIALGEEPWIDPLKACTIYPESWLETLDDSTRDSDDDNSTSSHRKLVCSGLASEYKRFAGVYQNSVFGTLTITPDPENALTEGEISFRLGKSGTGKLCKFEDEENTGDAHVLRFHFGGILEHYNEPVFAKRLNATLTLVDTKKPGERPTATVNLLGKSVYNWISELPTTSVPPKEIKADSQQAPKTPGSHSTKLICDKISILLTLALSLLWKVL